LLFIELFSCPAHELSLVIHFFPKGSRFLFEKRWKKLLYIFLKNGVSPSQSNGIEIVRKQTSDFELQKITHLQLNLFGTANAFNPCITIVNSNAIKETQKFTVTLQLSSGSYRNRFLEVATIPEAMQRVKLLGVQQRY
jgi:hypothetical protein